MADGGGYFWDSGKIIIDDSELDATMVNRGEQQ